MALNLNTGHLTILGEHKGKSLTYLLKGARNLIKRHNQGAH